MSTVQNTTVQNAGTLPKRIPPPSLPPIKMGADGKWTWDPTWYLYLYNVGFNALGASGAGIGTVINEMITQNITTGAGQTPVLFVDEYTEQDVIPGPPGPQGPPGQTTIIYVESDPVEPDYYPYHP